MTSRLTSEKDGEELRASLMSGAVLFRPFARLAAAVLANDLLQIGHGRPRAQLVEHPVRARRLPLLRRRAFGVEQIAERDRLRRTRLLAGGHHVAVLDRALVVTGAILPGHDALDAHRA